METTLIVCDFCSKQLKINGVFVPDVNDMVTINTLYRGTVHSCGACAKIYETAYGEVLDKVQKGVNFTVTYRMLIVNAIMEVSDEDVQKHFGTNGLEVKKNLIEDLQKE